MGLPVQRSQPSAFLAFRSCQLGLAVVEGQEAVGFEFQGAGYVEAVEGADAELGAVAAGQVRADIECVLGHCGGEPQSTLAIIFKCEVDPLRVRGRHLSSKDLPCERVRPLSEDEWCHMNVGPLAQKYVGRSRVLALNIDRYDEAGVGVNDQ